MQVYRLQGCPIRQCPVLWLHAPRRTLSQLARTFVATRAKQFPKWHRSQLTSMLLPMTASWDEYESRFLRACLYPSWLSTREIPFPRPHAKSSRILQQTGCGFGAYPPLSFQNSTEVVPHAKRSHALGSVPFAHRLQPWFLPQTKADSEQLCSYAI